MRGIDAFTVRAASAEDFVAVLALLRAADTADFGGPDFTAEMLLFDWSLPYLDLSTDSWLIERDGSLCGYARVMARRDHRDLDGWSVVHPDHRGHGMESILLDSLEGAARRHAGLAPPGEQVVLRLGVVEPDRAGHELLEQRGYDLVRHFWKMDVRLEGPVPEPAPPPGVIVRPFDTERDARAVHAVIEEAFVDHWGWVPRTFEEWAAQRLDGPGFDRSLWFVALERDQTVGALVGLVMEGTGWVGTLGVRPAWRARGIGECLLRHSFRMFAERGIMDVSLDVDSANATGAVGLYERVGMHVSRQYDDYQKQVRG